MILARQCLQLLADHIEPAGRQHACRDRRHGRQRSPDRQRSRKARRTPPVPETARAAGRRSRPAAISRTRSLLNSSHSRQPMSFQPSGGISEGVLASRPRSRPSRSSRSGRCSVDDRACLIASASTSETVLSGFAIGALIGGALLGGFLCLLGKPEMWNHFLHHAVSSSCCTLRSSCRLPARPLFMK